MTSNIWTCVYIYLFICLYLFAFCIWIMKKLGKIRLEMGSSCHDSDGGGG